MNFDISEEQELLQDTIRQFAAQECPPTKVRELFDGDEAVDSKIWQGLVELGLGGIALSEEYGGAGLELLDLALATEVLGETATPCPFFGHSLAGLAIQLCGSDVQRKNWLPKLASGEILGSVAFPDAGGIDASGWQPEDWTTRAGDSIRGSKAFVPAGTRADLLVVGVADGGLALVEAGASGVQIRDAGGIDRTRRLASVEFEDAPCELLPERGPAVARLRDAALVLLAADAFGGASKCVSMSVEYAQTREQFGVTIGHFQALKHQLANMATEIEPSRALYWYAAHSFDHIQDQSARSAALAKAHLTSQYMQIARDAVEAHGGIGFTWECDVQIYFKRAMFDRAFMGDPSVHRERVAQLSGW